MGNTLYISGQVARDISGKVCHRRDFTGQLGTVLNNIKNVVTTAGGTMQDIVKLTVYCCYLWYLIGMIGGLCAVLRRPPDSDDRR